MVTAWRDTPAPTTAPTPAPAGEMPPGRPLPGVRDPTPVPSPTLSVVGSPSFEPLGATSTPWSRLPASTSGALPEKLCGLRGERTRDRSPARRCPQQGVLQMARWGAARTVERK